MRVTGVLSPVWFTTLIFLPPLTTAQWEHGNSDALFNFVSRPDLKPPKWNLTVHHPDLVAPGYWFVSPYVSPRDKEDETDNWIGPHIYDSHGELVWSGTEMFNNGPDTMSFQMHNVRGRELMTTLDWSMGQGVIWDNHYEIVETVDIYGDSRTNAHEFHFVQDGSRAVVIKTKYETSSLEDARAAGLNNGKECHAHWDGIHEYDTETWETTWEWNSKGHIFLNESTYAETPIEKRCDPSHLGWDFIHCNSIDKNAEGDYFLSCRHSNTIYKISHKDGSILWRLGGSMSDFDQGNLVFGRQHNIRVREENGTHTMISFLDNAKGQDQQPPSHEHSRGLLLALDEKNMKSTVLKEILHPDLDYAPKRGNYQVLPNGNVFMGWSTKALHSEHAPDGTMVMQARMEAGWLGSYRNYKFDFVGQPLSVPDVHSAGYGIEGRDAARTVIHTSWNGATEVDAWRFYKTIATGQVKKLLGTRGKRGFETMIEIEGYASYVIVEGVDKSGTVLGSSGVFKTIPHPNMTAAAIEIENLWLLKANSEADGSEVNGVHEDTHVGDVETHIDDDTEPQHASSTQSEQQSSKEQNDILTILLQSQFAAFLLGFSSCGTIGVVVWLTWRRGLRDRLRGATYDPLQNESVEAIEGKSVEDDGYDEDATMVDDLESQKLLSSCSEKHNEPPDKF